MVVKLDTMRIVNPIEDYVGFDLRGTEAIKDFKTDMLGTVMTDKMTLRGIDHGFSSFEVDTLKNEVTLNVSAKILGNDYRDGISKNNIDLVADLINGYGFAEIKTDALLRSKIRRVDPNINIEVSDIQKCVSSVVQHAAVNRNYLTKHFARCGRDATLGYQSVRDVKSYKERQIGYSKVLDSKSKSFWKAYPKALGRFTPKTLRIESNIEQHSQIRKLFAVPDVILGQVLNSSENVNAKIFDRIITIGTQMVLFSDHFQNCSLPKIVDEIGYRGLFEMYNYDLVEVKRWIRLQFPKSTRSYYYKIVTKAYQEMMNVEIAETNSYVQEIKSLLLAA